MEYPQICNGNLIFKSKTKQTQHKRFKKKENRDENSGTDTTETEKLTIENKNFLKIAF